MFEELTEIRNLAAQGDLEQARALFRSRAESRVQVRGGHREWALAAEELGLFGLAEREFNLALRDDPGDVVALQHLVEFAEEKGAVERAVNLLVRLFELAPSAETALRLYTLYQEMGAEPKALELAEKCRALGIPLPRTKKVEEAAVSQEPVIPQDADLVRFLALFGGREDVYARQWFSPSKGEGGYSPVRQPLTPRELRAHLLGEVTLGVYPIRLDGTCLFAALDVDVQKSALEEARRSQALATLLKSELQELTAKIEQRLKEAGLTPIVEDSGYKGRHFWFPLAAPEAASTLVALGRAVIALVQPLLGEHFACEWFPKASRPGTKGLGNLIKLPLGIHRRTGRRSSFLDSQGAPIKKPFEYLRSVPLLTRETILAVLDRHRLATQSEDAAELPVPEEVKEKDRPPAPAPAPPWTAHDFETSPVFRQLLSGCAVLRTLTQKAIEERRLSYDEAIIIAHTFGHLPSGVNAANYLFSLVGTVPQHLRLKSPLRGNPVSCVKIRARIPAVTSRLPCNCVFSQTQDLYPTPLLHVQPEAQSPPGPPPSGELEILVRRLLGLEARMAALARDGAELRRAIVERLRLETQPYVEVAGVTLRLETKDGVDHLVIETAPTHE